MDQQNSAERNSSSTTLRIPANALGLAYLWSIERAGADDREIEWCSPYLNALPKQRVRALLEGLPALQTSRMRFLLSAEHNLLAPALIQSIHATIRTCELRLAMPALQHYVIGGGLRPRLLAITTLLLRLESERIGLALRSCLTQRASMLDLRGLPALLVPLLVVHLRQRSEKKRLRIVSSGHRLRPGMWIWTFPADAVEPDSVVSSRLTFGQIFQPDSARTAHEGQHIAG